MMVPRYTIELVKESELLYADMGKASGPRELVTLFNKIFRMDVQAEEVFCIICFDTKNRPIASFEVSRGGLASAIVHPREVFKRALLANSASIAVGHNHPSGETDPSKEDIQLVKRLQEAGHLLGVPLLDSIIIGDNAYYSWKEENLI